MAKTTDQMTTLAQLFLQAGASSKERPAFATRIKGGSFEMVSYGSWCERALALATGLIELGLEAREHVGLLSDNCFEWILIDAAVQFSGAADVPRGSDITPAEMKYIIAHADVKILFLENQKLLAQWQELNEAFPECSHIIIMKGEEGITLPEGVLTLASLEALGKRLREAGDRRVEERIAQLHPNDLYTIIYTSGTTGTPKGVQLTHASICSQVKNLKTVLIGEASSKNQLLGKEALRALSILPVWHSYERVFEMFVISQGGCTYYSSLRSLSQDLKLVRPNVMASAPRLWEVLYEKIIAEVERQSRFKKILFHNVINCEWLAALFRRWNLPPLPQLRSVVGGDLRATISGGGALPPYVDQFFNRIGIAVLEGYGLTESGPVLAVRTPEQLVIGTVGPLLPETEIKIIDLEHGVILYPDPSDRDLGVGRRGEICARGPQVMHGYYKDPEGTMRALREGWLHTGDIGVMTPEGCLKIVGRCKETIVLLNGENVEPLPIESRLLQSPFIAQCMVVGQDQKQLGLLIVPAAEVVTQQTTDLQQQQQIFQSEIRRLISTEHGFKAFEKIGPWRLLTKSFEVGDELTGTYKLKRHLIAEKYRALIEEMF
ncbi:MAG: AMP-binding protein [Chthoniobacterales bacterium]|nr:AMP-binding protein [Chthoniobacterales bacterium]